MYISPKLLVTSLLAFTAAAAPGRGGQGRPPKNSKFVTVDGEKFKLGNKDFHFAGSNAYYFPFNGVREQTPFSRHVRGNITNI